MGMSQDAIGEKFGLSQGMISKRLREWDVITRPANHNKYTCNEHFFDDLSLEIPSYWLGFILADGSVRRRSSGRSGELVLTQSSRDEEHLERFSKDIGFNGPIRRNNSYAGWLEDVSYLRITSEYLYQHLLDLGIKPRKKYMDDYSFPNVPQMSTKHAMRGFVDGDGGLYFEQSDGRPRINISSKSSVVLRDLKSNIAANCPFSLGGYETQDQRTKVWTFGWSAKRDCAWIATFLYGDCAVALQRKLEIAQQMMSMD